MTERRQKYERNNKTKKNRAEGHESLHADNYDVEGCEHSQLVFRFQRSRVTVGRSTPPPPPLQNPPVDFSAVEKTESRGRD